MSVYIHIYHRYYIFSMYIYILMYIYMRMCIQVCAYTYR